MSVESRLAPSLRKNVRKPGCYEVNVGIRAPRIAAPSSHFLLAWAGNAGGGLMAVAGL